VTIVLTSLARVNNWSTVRRLNGEVLVGFARDLRAIRYRVYRNTRDASQLLLLAELPDHEAVQDLARWVDEHLGAGEAAETPDNREWEVTDLDGIG
jgi:hypothetical protein